MIFMSDSPFLKLCKRENVISSETQNGIAYVYLHILLNMSKNKKLMNHPVKNHIMTFVSYIWISKGFAHMVKYPYESFISSISLAN